MAIADPEASSHSKTQAAARARARTRFNQSMKLVRRAHLYAGLFMTPWVFLYGITAMLFNHPLVFSDIEQKQRSITPADLAGTPLATFPTPQVLASQVVEAINATGGSDKASRYRLVNPDEASFAREYLTSVPGGETDHLVRLDLASGVGTVRTTPSRKEAEREAQPPFARRPVKLESAPMEAVTKSVSMLLTRFGLPQVPPAANRTGAGNSQEKEGERRGGPREEGRPSTEQRPETGGGRRGEGGSSPRPTPDASEPNEPTSNRRAGGRPDRDRDRGGEGTRKGEIQETAATPTPNGPAGGGGRAGRGGAGGGRGAAPAAPDLNFLMEGEGQVWRVGFNMQTGTLTGRPEDAPRAGESLSNRRFLLRLHTAHGYPSQVNARWIWAVAVDVMFVCMVGWGITGLLMWWQMKNVRRIGAVLLVLSAIVSVAVAIGMHSMMVAGS
ncbi:hypothetical protein [Singulisphaera acidiphila]|uniref:Uncharacterized protein n=1 Tax=Singulisphaera acidiphila (strain ATCC BAA-1392 / DSM 18658 / VKM B-2454 / MOB10) TaxID=886293 RepID=L0D5Z5_SINAD|nr:hypothetical protein [Singulisphaera acidiphila]AGA24682.1 hypothetical protein Sinac_0231 [Singulisphaera acidiphila DSM 18658]